VDVSSNEVLVQPNTEATISPEFLQAEPMTEESANDPAIVTTAEATEALKAALAVVMQEPTKEPKPKKKGIRYAPLSILAEPKAVIVHVDPNPKRANTESFDLYARFMVPSVGLTIAEYEANFAANHRQGRHRARRLLRWDYAHGFVKLELPPQPETEAPTPETPAAE
jgi:hypothetical protein